MSKKTGNEANYELTIKEQIYTNMFVALLADPSTRKNYSKYGIGYDLDYKSIEQKARQHTEEILLGLSNL